MTGKTFGYLTVLYRDIEKENEKKLQHKHVNTIWRCQCKCGNQICAEAWSLKSGHTKSCGCLQKEVTEKRNKLESTKINKIFKTENDIKDFNINKIIRVYGKNGESFIVDADDYDFIKKWFWRKDKKGYWITNAKKEDVEKYGKKMLRLHQIIALRKYGEYDSKTLFPDHLSRDKSDNRKCNLILKTNKENMKNRNLSKANTSGKTGVSYSENKGMWVAYITINYKTIFLGDFINYEDAVNARLTDEKKYGFTCDDKVANYDKAGDTSYLICTINIKESIASNVPMIYQQINSTEN